MSQICQYFSDKKKKKCKTHKNTQEKTKIEIIKYKKFDFVVHLKKKKKKVN